jgi:hypothetical protein
LHPRILFPLVLGIAFATGAMAASPGSMMEDGKNSAQDLFQDDEARSDMKFEGQRADGTHAVNGTIHLENRSEDFQCCYDTAGDTLVDLIAEGESQPTFVKGGGPHMSR